MISFKQAGSALLWQSLQHIGVKLIFLARLLVLARLLSPDDFGLLAIASVAIDILMRITDFGMIPALVQRVEANDAHYDAAWTVGVVRALVVSGVTLVAASLVSTVFAEPRAIDIIRVLALRPIIDAAASIKVAELTRELNFRSLAFMKIPKALANTLVSIVLAPWLGVWALVAGTLAGPSAYMILSYVLAPYRPRLNLDFGAAQSLIRFGRWIFLTGLIAMAGQSLLRAIISRELGATELGLYYLAASLAFLPAEVASQVVGEVSFPFYARLQTDVKQVALAFKSILTSLAVLIIPSSGLLIALTPSLVDTILGSQWEGTAPIIRVLALANIIGLLGETVGPILRGTGRPAKAFFSSAVQYTFLVVFVWGLAQRFGVVGAAIAWLPAIFASQIANLIFIRQILPNPFTGMRLSILSIAAVSVMVTVIALYVDIMINGLAGLIVAGLLGVATSGAVFWILERRFSIGLSVGLARAFPQVATWMGLPRR
ncbi:MAG: oligosaccharide flippase family protein [Anaerolineales bacterium]